MVEELEREQVEPVRPAPWIEHVAREHRVEVEAAQRDAGAPQHEDVVLRVLRRLCEPSGPRAARAAAPSLDCRAAAGSSPGWRADRPARAPRCSTAEPADSPFFVFARGAVLVAVCIRASILARVVVACSAPNVSMQQVALRRLPHAMRERAGSTPRP